MRRLAQRHTDVVPDIGKEAVRALDELHHLTDGDRLTP
jgi:hypothetical protein